MTDLQLETTLVDAADRLLQISPAKRAGWIVFLLEALDNAPRCSAGRDEYELMLSDVSGACCDREMRGSW